MRRLTRVRERKNELALMVLAGLVAAIVVLEASPRPGFVSSELNFSDASAQGFGILPASCPSNPHTFGACTCTTGTTLLSENADGKGYKLSALTPTRRISRFSAYFCVENTSASNSYFIPANTKAELDSFRGAAPSGVNVWGYATYSQAYYQGYYQGYYQSYYQGYYQGYYQSYYGPKYGQSYYGGGGK